MILEGCHLHLELIACQFVKKVYYRISNFRRLLIYSRISLFLRWNKVQSCKVSDDKSLSDAIGIYHGVSRSLRSSKGFSGVLGGSRGLSGALGGSRGLSRALGSSQAISRALWGSWGPSGALRGSQGLSGALRGFQGLSRALWGYQGLSRAIRDSEPVIDSA